MSGQMQIGWALATAMLGLGLGCSGGSDGDGGGTTTTTAGHHGGTGGAGGAVGTGGESGGSTGEAGGAPTSCEGGGVCAQPAPTGWTGPVVLYVGPDPAPSCPAAMGTSALQAYAELDTVDPAECTCTCELKGTSCKGSFSLQGYAGANCTAPSCGTAIPAGELGTCQPYISGKCSNQNPAPVVAWDVSINATSEAWCKPSAGSALPPAPKWKTLALGCGSLSLSPGECTGGSVCVPQPGAPFLGGACVLRTGDEQCPAGPYTKRSVVFGAAEDTRACSECSCGGPAGGSCQGTLSLKSGVGCTGQSLGSAAVPGCAAKPSGSGYLIANVSFVGATCPATGGTPTGTVTPTGPTTVCCLE